ncbi:hypothetical protein OAG71_01445 [bacterium]|nr:hypothetical protein [bacterium]
MPKLTHASTPSLWITTWVALLMSFVNVGTNATIAAQGKVVQEKVDREKATQEETDQSESAQTLKFGFADQVKLGHWVPVQIPADWAADADEYSITTMDGDESPVTFTGPLEDANTAYVRFGKKFGSVKVELLKAGDMLRTFQSDKSDLEHLKFSKSTELLTVVIGGNEGLVANIKSSIAAESSNGDTTTVSLPAVAGLPEEALGWQSVNRLVISTASLENIRDVSPRVWTAIADWVESGGDLVLIGDPKNIDSFADAGPLATLVPGQVQQVVQMKTSRDLERFVGTSRRQLIGRDDDSLPMLKVTPAENATVVAEVNDLPLLVRSVRGFGRLSFCALSLENDRLVQWPSLAALVEKIIASDDQQKNQKMRSDLAKRSTTGLTHSGYTDMLGQLRVPLDDFSTVRFLPFTLIAVLITLYILCVAVGDYFFLKKILRKMELTWITFPLLALLFCGLAFAISKATRPAQLQINQMEIIDFDLTSGASRGTAWVNLYAPSGETVDVDLETSTSFQLDIGQQIVSWQGLPGDGLGGMGNEVSTGFKKLPYQQIVSTPQDGNVSVSLKQLPLQVASTKPLLISYKIANPENFSSQLSVKRDRLEGTFKNPLSVPLYNGKIFFGDYVYLLKKPLQPDVVTLVESDAKERTLRSYLNRRAPKGGGGNEIGRSQNQPWDPDEKSLTRIADVMMFYEAAGGQKYTGLSNGYHREIDFSRLLRLGQAVLVGQTESGSRIKIDGQDVSDNYDSNITMVRIVLPVTKN